MAIKVSTRTDIAPFFVMEVMRAAARREAQGDDVVHLEVGQPSTAAPAGARAAAVRAIEHEVLGYTAAVGLEALRERLSRHYDEWYGTTVDPGRIVLAQGASGAFTLAFLACFDVGDRVVVPSPGYPCYRNTLAALGVEVVDLPVDHTTRYQPSPDHLAALHADRPIDGLVVASPSNPTGTMLLPEELSGLVAWCSTNGVRLISDEIYHGITFGVAAPTAVSLWNDAVVVNSFSKYFSMTGWRLGWLVLPPELVAPVERLAQNATVAPPTISQHAALGAFDSIAELEANVDRYRTNRAILLDGLPEVGIDRLAPADGAFYIYADVSHLTDDSQALCQEWLDRLGIATTPGIDFDPQRGHRFVRFSFAGTPAEMTTTIDRLRAWSTDR